VDPKKKTVPILKGEEPGKPKDLPEDPIEALTLAGDVIEPPFDLLTLATLPEHNTELTPCLDAMTQNIDGFGFRLIPRVKVAQRHAHPQKVTAQVDHDKLSQERTELENFFAYVTLDISFIEFRKRLRVDMESTGNGYFEVIRSSIGRIQGFTHIPSYQMRVGRQEPDPFLTLMPILQLQPGGAVTVEKVQVWRRFRRFVQSKAIQRRNLSFVGGYQLRYFKEFGDLRQYHFETGELLTGDKLLSVPPEQRANEMVHFKLYSPRSPYGLPRFIGNLLSIMGDRAAEEINYVTFRNNNVPSMLVLVSNGQLTSESINRLKDFVESQIQGSDNYSKFILLEAEGLMEGDEGGQVKIDVKPLTATQHLDALFQNYSKNNQDKIRRCFRLPPIFVGRSDDYTRATAEASRQLADEQIFAPERDSFDNWVNRILFPEMGIVYHKFKSNSPNTTDNAELTKILAGAERTGGMTPRIARMMLEDILGQELPEFPEDKDFNPDLPFSLLMAEAVKNQANPAEPGQQLTALKTIDSLTGADIPLFQSDEDEVTQKLLRLRDRLEREWRTSSGGLPEGEGE
jgi:PBSX family phage portal protein